MKGLNILKIFVVFFITLSIASCSYTKHLKEGEVLYIGSEVNITDSITKTKEKKELASGLNNLTVPEPNTTFLGLKPKLFFYNLAGDPSKTGWLRKKLRSFGEPPVLLQDVNLEYNEKLLDSRLENLGYFRANVSGDTIVKNKKAEAVYAATPGPRYYIAAVEYQNDSSVLERSINEIVNSSFLKPGDPFNLDIIKAERLRIDAYLKEQGFYYFNEDYIIVKTDSTIGNNQVNLYVQVKPETPKIARQVYTMNDIFVYSNYSLATAQEDTNTSNAIFYKGYYVVDKENIFKPKLFQKAILFNPGDIYKRTKHNLTLNRLITLDLFKFVKNRYEPLEVNDSSKLDNFYYLTPYPKKSIRAEVGASTKDNNFTGTNITFGFRNRNTFKGGELLAINVHAGSEVQISGNTSGNSYRTGADVSFAVPRFWIPFFNLNTRGGFLPKTNLKLGFEILNRSKLYTINSFNATYGYSWKESIIRQHELNPMSITYVQPIKVTDLYKQRAVTEPALQNVIDTQFILGSNYKYLWNQLQTGSPFQSGFYFDGLLDLSGNIAGLFNSGDLLQGKPSRIAGAIFSQYIKTQADFRYYLNLTKTSVLANRIVVGFGYPYGNSVSLPFIKQFFAGGNNSVRAFRSRSVGPGTYISPLVGASTFLPDQAGDLKLELNTEYRAQISGFLHGALFVDAGNIWLYRQNPNAPKPGAVFSKDFMKELAVGAGAGLRFDFTVLVLRIDVAIPLRKPWLPAGERWVTNQIDFGNKDWRSENIIFNLAIGYPF
ncbi:MAG: BamA/TamA family outer membrane protein [Chitinophagaceae bacterium]|nr:BamA/TamA family outer membrane protein [Chitinophagaceae bacterium]